MTIKQGKYYWGVLLPSILSGLEAKKNDKNIKLMHKALKTYFQIPSIAKLTTAESEVYFKGIRILMNVEYGLLLPLPNEPSSEVLMDMGMEDFLLLPTNFG